MFYSNDKSNVGLWSSSWSLAIILLIKWCCKTNDEAAVTHLGIVAWSQSMTRFLDLEKSPEILNNSNENSRSTTRNPFFISRPLLEIRDLMEQNLDLVSNNEIIKILILSRKKNEIIIHIFFWACILFLPPPHGIYVVHSHQSMTRFLDLEKSREI